MIPEAGKQACLKAEGLICPYCGFEDIGNAEEFVFGGQGATKILLKFWCYSCRKVWTAIYALSDLRESDSPMPEPVYSRSIIARLAKLFGKKDK